MKDVLIINSYAGSLVLGARAAGVPIRGSYEDGGFGIAIQKLNFPELKFKDKLPWPEDDLSETVVIAHPPCAAFSNMNIVAEKRGLGTDAFECHRKVMEYALGHGCEALAIESVTGALQAAGQAYGDFAARLGYEHYFILLNAISFGVPQWRPRFWVVFLRTRGANLQRQLYCSLYPRYTNVQSVLDGRPATDPVTLKHVDYLHRKYTSAGFDFEAMMKSECLGGFDKLAKTFFEETDTEKVKELTGTKGLYRAGLPRKLDPTLWAPVILGFSLWYVHDRPLNQVEYQRIMGFPDDYRWPEKENKDFLTFLSKGVCPPVATWIIQQIAENLKGVTPSDSFTHVGRPGEVLDLQPQKKVVQDILRGTTALPERPTNSFISWSQPHASVPSEPPSTPDVPGGGCSGSPGPPPFADPWPPRVGDLYRWDGEQFILHKIGERRAAEAGDQVAEQKIGGHRLAARTGDFRSPNPGSTPGGPTTEAAKWVRESTTKLKNNLTITKTDRYQLAEGVEPTAWKEGSHAYAVAEAIRRITDSGSCATKGAIANLVKEHKLINTTMDVGKAVSWMLNQLLHKGKVVECLSAAAANS